MTERQRFIARLVLEHVAELVRDEAVLSATDPRYATVATEGVVHVGEEADRFRAALVSLGSQLQRCAEEQRADSLEEWICEWIAP